MAAELVRSRVNLRELLGGIADAPAIAIQGICGDSRNATAGDAFFAVQGQASHGLDYLEQVLAAGVAAVVWDQDTGSIDSSSIDVPMIPVVGLSKHIGKIANRWFDAPSSRLKVAGVTGTNGKTTVAWLIVQCMQRLGQRSAYIGTLGAGITELQFAGGITTPACIELHGLLADFVQAGSTTAALEVSSHGIEQRRVDGVQFDAALFTNLSRDHMDYHDDMESYFETKARLFLEGGSRHCVICVDNEYGRTLVNRMGSNVVTASVDLQARIGDYPFVNVRRVVANEHGSQVFVHSSWGDEEFNLPMPGNFNVANAILVLALLLRWDVPLSDACRVLGEVTAPPGRMQRVEHAALPAVFVDYAHTPAGLEAALDALRPHCRAEMWCVFGCGGDRDHGKRPQMGAAVARLADHAVVTNDNPRSEEPGEIIAEILQAMPKDATAIEDRAAAIAYAITTAGDEDIVLIAGKGHEEYQIIGEQRLPFSDYTTALANLSARQARCAARR